MIYFINQTSSKDVFRTKRVFALLFFKSYFFVEQNLPFFAFTKSYNSIQRSPKNLSVATHFTALSSKSPNYQVCHFFCFVVFATKSFTSFVLASSMTITDVYHHQFPYLCMMEPPTLPLDSNQLLSERKPLSNLSAMFYSKHSIITSTYFE